VRQHTFQGLAEPLPVQKTAEGRDARVAGDLLVGEPDLDGFGGSLEFNKTRSLFGERSFPYRLMIFSLSTNRIQTVATSATE